MSIAYYLLSVSSTTVVLCTDLRVCQIALTMADVIEIRTRIGSNISSFVFAYDCSPLSAPGVHNDPFAQVNLSATHKQCYSSFPAPLKAIKHISPEPGFRQTHPYQITTSSLLARLAGTVCRCPVCSLTDLLRPGTLITSVDCPTAQLQDIQVFPM